MGRSAHTFTVTVGRKMSKANYYVDDPSEVLLCLQMLARVSYQESQKHNQSGPLTIDPSTMYINHSYGSLEQEKPILNPTISMLNLAISQQDSSSQLTNNKESSTQGSFNSLGAFTMGESPQHEHSKSLDNEGAPLSF